MCLTVTIVEKTNDKVQFLCWDECELSLGIVQSFALYKIIAYKQNGASCAICFIRGDLPAILSSVGVFAACFHFRSSWSFVSRAWALMKARRLGITNWFIVNPLTAIGTLTTSWAAAAAISAATYSIVRSYPPSSWTFSSIFSCFVSSSSSSRSYAPLQKTENLSTDVCNCSERDYAN